MSETVHVPFEGNAREKAILLLAAAEGLGLGKGVVRTSRTAFVVPSEVNEKAFGKGTAKKAAAAPAKKAAAKKAPAKKSASKRSAAKKSTQKPQE